MLVRKKRQVQKSFRIDEEVERDLGILAQITERSQNELANVAIEELLQDNKYYFLSMAVLEHFSLQFENANESLEPFEMGGLRVEIEYSGDVLKVHSTIKDKGEVVDDYMREFDSDISAEFESYLKDLSIYINSSAEDTIKYLNDRVDYRDYVKVRKK